MNQDADRGTALWDWLELLRLPNLFTAMADVAMGFLFVQVAAEGDATWQMRPLDAWVLGLLAVASSLLYAAGVVLNDVADVEVDRQQRPERPIPSGRISLAAASRCGWLLLFAGIAAAWSVAGLAGQLRPGLIGLLLAAAVVLYDLGLKRTPLGPVGMGGCRMLNVLLGMSVLAGTFRPEHFLVAGGIGVYVVGITWLARNETAAGDRRQIFAATLVMMAGIALLAWLPDLVSRLPAPKTELVDLLRVQPGRWYLLMGLLGAMIGWRCLYAAAEPGPGRVQMAVTHGIMSLVILDAAACFATRGVSWAIVILCLLLPAMVLGRWLQST